MRRRLVLAIASVASVAVLLFALPLAVVLQRSYRDEELLRLQRDTVAATRGIDLGHSIDPIELPRFTGTLGVYTRRGVRIAGAGPRIADQSTRDALGTGKPSGSAPGGRLVVAVPLLHGEAVNGAMRALDTLTAAARRVGEGDFAVRAAPTGIEEIDDVGAALNGSSQRVAELIGRERTFSADASHQLRTPLAALRLALESGALRSQAHQPELTAALTQVDRLQSRIETLLAVARGTPTAERKTDLQQAVSELESHWHGPLAADGRPLLIIADAERADAAISPAVLAEIIDILMQNAQVHGTGAVSVAVRRLGDVVALEVSDQGVGFGANAEEAFRRGSGDGHGIGLALARSLAHSAGARLQITHPADHPTVSLLLPRLDDRFPPALA